MSGEISNLQRHTPRRAPRAPGPLPPHDIFHGAAAAHGEHGDTPDVDFLGVEAAREAHGFMEWCCSVSMLIVYSNVRMPVPYKVSVLWFVYATVVGMAASIKGFYIVLDPVRTAGRSLSLHVPVVVGGPVPLVWYVCRCRKGGACSWTLLFVELSSTGRSCYWCLCHYSGAARFTDP